MAQPAPDEIARRLSWLYQSTPKERSRVLGLTKPDLHLIAERTRIEDVLLERTSAALQKEGIYLMRVGEAYALFDAGLLKGSAVPGAKAIRAAIKSRGRFALPAQAAWPFPSGSSR